MQKRIYCLIVLFAFLLTSCGDDGGKYSKPGPTGKAGELVIVVEKALWKGKIGSELRKTFHSEIPGLPQTEPFFDIINIPVSAFSRIFESHRNILITKISKNIKKSSIKIRHEPWAQTQLVVNISAPDEKSFLEIYKKNRDKILNVFKQTERNRLIDKYKKFEEKALRKHLEDKHQISLFIPKGYKINYDTTDFVWFFQETRDILQGVLVYHYPYCDTSDLLPPQLIDKRNRYLKRFVPGPQGTYMSTDTINVPLYCSKYLFNDNYTVDMKGLWNLKGGKYFMGGPFVSLTTVDKRSNRVITVEGYVFAPRLDKRPYLRQVEAILHSFSFPKIEAKN